MRLSRCTRAASEDSVCAVRSPKLWLGLLSITTAATEGRGSRSSRVSDGLASAATRSTSAIVRISAPRVRLANSSSAITATAAMPAHITTSGTSGEKVRPKPTRTFLWILLAEPLEQRGHVHLIGFVVAGKRVHDDVHSGAKGELALARLARNEWQHRLAVAARRPGAGEVVRGDDDRGYAVAAARRTLRLVVVLVDRRHRLDPELSGIEAAGEVAQQEERLRQHVVLRHRLELGNIERGEARAQRHHAGAARLAARPRRRHHGIARLEQHGAAALHVGIDAREHLRRRSWRVRHDRPVDQRKERELVAA